MRAGAELLLVPGGDRLLPGGRAANRPFGMAVPLQHVCAGAAAAFRRDDGTVDMRMDMPFRHAAGPALPHTGEEAAPLPQGELAAAGEIRGTDRARHPITSGGRGFAGGRAVPGGPMVLQVPVPGGDGAGGAAARYREHLAAGRGGVAFRVEGIHRGGDPRPLRIPVPLFLQVPVPAGGHLRAAEPAVPLQAACGEIRVHELREV